MFLLDTCLISEFARTRPSPAVTSWFESQDERAVYLSAITIGELHRGIVAIAERPRREDMQRWLVDDIVGEFTDRILAFDTEIALRWGTLVGTAKKKGRPVPFIDSLLSATALVHGLTVVTRNTDDFIACGVKVVNPWQ